MPQAEHPLRHVAAFRFPRGVRGLMSRGSAGYWDAAINQGPGLNVEDVDDCRQRCRQFRFKVSGAQLVQQPAAWIDGTLFALCQEVGRTDPLMTHGCGLAKTMTVAHMPTYLG